MTEHQKLPRGTMPPLRTLEQVKAGLARAKKNKADVSLARAMLRVGRLTDEARDYVREHYAP